MPTPDLEQLRRWRLILGKDAQQPLDGMCGGAGGCGLAAGDAEMDAALAAIYDEVPEDEDDAPKQRSAGLGSSAPRLAKWLGDIRTYFKEDVVSVIQADAIERKGLTQLLFEPETLKSVQPNIQLVGTLMSLKRPHPGADQGDGPDGRRRRGRGGQEEARTAAAAGGPRCPQPQGALAPAERHGHRLEVDDRPEPEELQPRASGPSSRSGSTSTAGPSGRTPGR